MKYMKSRRVRDFVTDQRFAADREFATDQKLRIEKRGDRNEETTE